MTMTAWPPAERPREKLLAHGAKNLSDAELLAIFLHTGIRGKTALDIARELLGAHSSLKKLFNKGPHALLATPGIGKAKYALLKAALELGRRYLEEGLPIGKALNSSAHTKRFLHQRLHDYPHEVFACLFLDSQQRTLSFEELFHGTLTEAHVYPREVVKCALALNAAKVILAHNHPSGDPTPSQADHEITRILQQALALVDITLLDHIVVGRQESVSFAELGLL